MTSNAERQRRHKAKMEEAGFVQANIWVPPHALPDVKLMAELMRQHPHLTVGPLRDTVSQRLVGLRATVTVNGTAVLEPVAAK